MNIKKVTPRKRSSKIYWGKAESQLPQSKGQQIVTAVVSSSRQKAQQILARAQIKVTRREFFAWPDEDLKHYSFLTAGVWQSNFPNPKKSIDFVKLNPLDETLCDLQDEETSTSNEVHVA